MKNFCFLSKSFSKSPLFFGRRLSFVTSFSIFKRKKYEVDTCVASSLDSSSQEYKVLQSVVEASQAQIVNLKDDTVISSGLIYLDMLWPTQEYQYADGLDYEENVLGISATSNDPDSFSVVAVLRLENFRALFIGDIVPDVAEKMVFQGLVEDVDYIKAPHHGSKNGLTKSLLEASSPGVVVISVGERNAYGHPHKEVISMLEEKGVLVKRTDLEGNVEVITNGRNWWSN